MIVGATRVSLLIVGGLNIILTQTRIWNSTASRDLHSSSVIPIALTTGVHENIVNAWKHMGLNQIPDANDGAPQRVAETVEDRRDGLRQLTSVAYPLERAHIMTDTFVDRIILSDSTLGKVAIGVEFVGYHPLDVKASCKVLLCCGPYRIPQVRLRPWVRNFTIFK
ncbi:hypothetical protein XANCAGTX0491_003022 [Xanthoria calcicola]